MTELARILVLAIAAAIVVNLVQGGPDQAKAWLSAKFLGRVSPKVKHPAAAAKPGGSTAAELEGMTASGPVSTR